MAKVCTSCEESGGIECSLKHNGLAIIFLQEAMTRPTDDARQRCFNAYSHLSHSSDVHLPEAHPKLASRCRAIRKELEPCIFGRSNHCPPPKIVAEIEELNQELVDALAKFEGHTKHAIVAEQVLEHDGKEDNVRYLRQKTGTPQLGGSSRLASEAAKEVGTIIGGAIIAYAADSAIQMVDAQMPTANVWMRPSNIAKYVGAIGVPVYAAYKKGASARTKQIAAGVAAYYVPQLIQFLRSMTSTPVRFAQQKIPFVPTPVAAPTTFVSAPIF